MVDNEEKLDRLFCALGDRTRRKMLMMLTKNSLNVSELGEPFKATKQSISKHLKVLEEAGLVSKRKDGRIQHCNFNPSALEEVENVVGQYREFWGKQLDALDEYINSVNKQKRGFNGKKAKS
jgi:DNA-binding transcriptional ArsR family regulator